MNGLRHPVTTSARRTASGFLKKLIDGLVYSGWLRLAEFKHHIIRLMPMNVWRRWRRDTAIPAETGTVIAPEKAA